ncbi:hypothetical protein [Streptacidiphilus sp. PAMC 29251]
MPDQAADAPAGRRRRAATGDGESILHLDDTPIFTTLAEQWRREGRMLPGQRDRVWSLLVMMPSDRGAVPDFPPAPHPART